MEDTNNFEIECSDFIYVSKGIKNGKALRFTVTWKFEHPKYGLIAQSEEGWLMTRNIRGDLKVSPPINRFGAMQSKQLKHISVGFHDLIVAMIVNHKTKSGTSYADYIGTSIPEELRAKVPGQVDDEFNEISEEVRS